MRHLTTTYVTDPMTGKRYAIPAGGADDAPNEPPAGEGGGANQPEPEAPKGGEGDGDDEPLGDAGIKALRAEREARAKAERELKAEREKREALERAAMDEHERAIAEAREEAARAAREETASVYQKRLIEESVRAEAAGKLADPDLALRLIDSDSLLGEDGMVDRTKVAASVADLLSAHPYLAGGATPPTPGADLGARRTTDDGPDLESMSPEEVLDWHAKRKAG